MGPEDPEPSGPPTLRTYKESHYRALGSRIAGRLGEAELLARVQATRVLLLGDLHDDGAHHGRALALLQRLHHGGRRLVLLLEAIGAEDDAAVQAFLDGRLELGPLRAAVARRSPDSWLEERGGIDAAFYRELLQCARAWSVPVRGLEPVPRLPLPERDQRIAATVRRAAERWPHALLVVVVGHTHLLGDGRLLERVALPAVGIGARLSVTLAARLQDLGPDGAVPWLATESGVLVRDPRVP